MKKKLILVLIALVLLALPAIALADTGGTNATDILIENAVEIAVAFFIALIGVFGAWLTAKLG